jgi:hypothetical protein
MCKEVPLVVFAVPSQNKRVTQLFFRDSFESHRSVFNHLLCMIELGKIVSADGVAFESAGIEEEDPQEKEEFVKGW